MKRLISILVIVAMMLASVLAMIPAYATEGEGEGDATVTEPITEYNYNWKELVDGGHMRSQWLYERQAGQNNMAAKYNITATDTALSLDRENGKPGDHRQYYSDIMFDITADTQYVYELEVKSVSPEGDGGFIFAFANNPKGRDESDGKQDIDGNKISDKVAAYFLNGKLNTGSAGLYFGGAWPNYGYEDQKVYKQDIVDAEVSEDGYTKYKIVYTGLNAEFFYFDKNGAWVELYADQTITLAEGAKLTAGIYAWNMDWANIKNCVVYANNEAAVAAMNAALTADRTAFEAKLAEAEAYNQADWLPADWAKFVTAVDFAETSAKDAAYKYVLDYNIARINMAMTKLNTTASNIKPKLDAEIVVADALVADQALYTETSWAKFAAALENAKTVTADETAAQSALVAAYIALTNTKSGLLTIELAAKNVYNVNWKILFENNSLRSQWWWDNGDGQNNYLKLYKVTATDTLLGSEPIGDADNRSYYSTMMIDINEYTYYEYTFEAKNDRAGGYAGILFAYDTNDFPYFVYGQFDNSSDNGTSADFRYRKGHQDRNTDGHNSKLDNDARHYPVLDLTEAGFGQFKYVYDGYNFSFYAKTEGDYKLIWSYTLPEGSKICVGVYSRGGKLAERRTMTLQNCAVTAYNDAATDVLFGTVTEYLFALADKKLAENFTPATEKAVSDAVAAVKAIKADTPYEEANAAIIALVDAILGLKMADKTALNAAIEAANAAIADKTAADFEERYYTPFAEALATATTVAANENATQEEADAACAALVNTTKYLTPAGAACKVDLVDVLAKYAALVETDYKPSSWATLAAPFATAEELNAAELTNEDQAAVDAAVEALNAAIDALIKRADFSKLLAAIERAEGLDKNDYIVETWNIDDVLAAAKTAAADLESEQAPLDEALAALNAAINALVTWRTNVLAIAPADDYVCNSSEYGDNPSWYNKITDMSYYGLGNVFYYDYHKLLAAKAADGFVAGTKFPQSMKEMNIQGSADYTLRLGTNVSGSGSNRVTDGDRLGTALEHRADPTDINGTVYSHVFGFSFAKAPTVDSIAVYLPTDTKIVSIDVYGSVRQTLEDGTVLYGKTDKDAVVTEEGVRYEAGTAAKTYLGTVEIPAAAEGAENIYASADFMQAMKVEYIYFAIQYAEGTGVNNYYYIYEIELFGLNEGEMVDGKVAPDFSKFNAAYAAFDALVEADYTEDSIAAVYAAIAAGNGIVNNVKGAQADIDAAGAALEAAVAALKAKDADWTALDAAITAGAPITEAEYTPKTYAAFKVAYDAAVALRAGTNVPQTAVNKATAALTEVFAGLAKRADKTALIPAVEEAKTIVKEAWNGNTVAWNMFEKALNEAIAMLTDDNATQEEVNAKVEALAARRAELKANPGYVPPVDPTPDETDPPKDETDPPKATDDNKATEAPAPEGGCGGCGSSAALSALAIVGVIGTAVVLKKKED